MSPPARVETSAKRSRRQAKVELHRARAQVSPSQRSESVKLRGNSRVSRGVSPRWCAESVQLRENSTGHAPRCRSVRKAFGCVARVCRAVKLRGTPQGTRPGVAFAAFCTRQAKGELHRARVQELHKPRAQVSPPRRSESVQLIKGELRPGVPSAAFRTPRGTRPGVEASAKRSRVSHGCVAPSS